VSGIAQSNERVSELLRNTSQNGVWVERPELIEIKSSAVGATTRESARVYEFAMRLKIKRPGDAAMGEKSDKPKPS
ncbi:MAG: PilN domain-containing protein, partial [Rubrivivax sp.]